MKCRQVAEAAMTRALGVNSWTTKQRRHNVLPVGGRSQTNDAIDVVESRLVGVERNSFKELGRYRGQTL